MWPPKVILHPSDFSENAENAFRLACELAQPCCSKVIVLHAHMPPALAMGDMPPMPLEIEDEDEARRKLNMIQSNLSGVVLEHKMVTGTAVEVILNTARSVHADLIVMGTYGRSGFKRLLLGSVADHVLRRTPCPMLIVPPKEQTNVEASNKAQKQQENAADRVYVS